MKNLLRIKNATFYAYHGVLSEEQKVGRKFEVDAELYFSFQEAFIHDKLEFTVNYVNVYKVIQDYILNNKFYLIEKLSLALAKMLLSKFQSIDKVIIKIRKCHPPVGGLIDNVEAITELTRDEK